MYTKPLIPRTYTTAKPKVAPNAMLSLFQQSTPASAPAASAPAAADNTILGMERSTAIMVSIGAVAVVGIAAYLLTRKT